MTQISPEILTAKPIKFGTDGWRGVIAADFTFERVRQVARAAAQVLAEVYGPQAPQNQRIIVGHDRRFLAEEFARVAAEAICEVGFEVWLGDNYAPTPAFSWAAKDQGALGAMVLTASHNPAPYLGLKVKGAFGGSVPPEVTQKIEARLGAVSPESLPPRGPLHWFDPWPSYCQTLRSHVDIGAIQGAIAQGQLLLMADVMHGAAAGGLARLLEMPIHELHAQRDPLFGGHAPEPLPLHLSEIMECLANQSGPPGTVKVGFVFDGDCDRIAAIDGQGQFLSSQILIPILIDHLAAHRHLRGEIVKTISGSDLIPKVAQLHGLEVHQTAVGYKYIADRMLTTSVLLGGEESGGIGYGHHIPERDALLSALYVLEAIVQSKTDLSQRYQDLQQRVGFTFAYDRIDLPLATMEVRSRLLQSLQDQPLTTIAGQAVIDCLAIDGYKFRLQDQRWLLIRFSGTEPVLRLYCEAPTLEDVYQTLAWAKNWAYSV